VASWLRSGSFPPRTAPVIWGARGGRGGRGGRGASGALGSLGTTSTTTSTENSTDATTSTVGRTGSSGGTGRTGSTSATTAVASPSELLPSSVTPGSAIASNLPKVPGALSALPQAGPPLGTLVQKLAAEVTGTAVSSLRKGSFGPSTSSITSSGGLPFNAESTDTGSTIGLLPGAGGRGGPLLSVDVGQSTSGSHVDLSDGKVTESASAASVTVTLSPPLGASES